MRANEVLTASGRVHTPADHPSAGGPATSAGVTGPIGAMAVSDPGSAVFAICRASVSMLKSATKYSRFTWLTGSLQPRCDMSRKRIGGVEGAVLGHHVLVEQQDRRAGRLGDFLLERDDEVHERERI